MIEPSPWLKLAGPVLQDLRRLAARLSKRSSCLIFVEQPETWWSFIDAPNGGTIQLHVVVLVTNLSKTDGVIVSRVQVRLAGRRFALRKDPWQDCAIVDVGDKRLIPMSVGPYLAPRTSRVLRIIHHHSAKRPPPQQRSLEFLLRITDQIKHFHFCPLNVPTR
jgi:hypothetical protein